MRDKDTPLQDPSVESVHPWQSVIQTPPGYKSAEYGLLPDGWDLTPLEQLASFITKGATPTTYGFAWQDDGVLFLRSECVSESGLDLAQSMYISPAAHRSLQRSQVSGGDLLITITGNVGRVVRLGDDIEAANINQHIARIRIVSADADPGYVYYFLSQSKARQRYNTITTGQAYPQLSLEQVRETPIPIPPLPEQRAIAEVLSDVDALLDALDTLIAKKRALKQGAMQQLLTGKTRLPGFSGEWQRRAFGEVLRVCHGRSQWDVVKADGLYPILATGGEIGRSDSYLYDKPSVLVGRKGTIDAPQYIETPFWTIDTLFYTQIAETAYPKYLYYLFQTIDWRSHNEASGVPSLNARTIEAIMFDGPHLTEQRAIAAVLSDMDAEIEAIERRRDKTRALKQGMMQTLLTGTIRLV